jgi:hypothetical protein
MTPICRRANNYSFSHQSFFGIHRNGDEPISFVPKFWKEMEIIMVKAKRPIGICLALIMLVSIVPATAFASGPIYDVGATISGIGISLGGETLSDSRSYSVRTNIAGAHLISVSCGGNNMAAGTQIIIEIDGTPAVIPLAEIPSPALADVAIERSLQPGAHTVAVSAVLVPGVGGMESLAIDSLSLTEYMAVASPAFSLPSGSYTRATALSITLPSEWKNAKIRYTTDGSEPSATAGTEYAGVLNHVRFINFPIISNNMVS